LDIFLILNINFMQKKVKKFLIYGGLTMIFLVNLYIISPANAVGMSGVAAPMWDPSGNFIDTPFVTIDSISVYFTPDGEINTNDGIKINFQSDFDISDITGNENSVALSQANSGTNIIKGTVTISGQDLLITVATQGDTPSGAMAVNVSGNHIYTPTSSGTYKISVSTWDLGTDNAWGGAGVNADTLEDSGAAAVIIGPNRVTISAAVDSSLTLTLSSNTCVLGTLSSTNIQTCQYNSTVSTNAAGGYMAYVKDDGNFRNATNDINDVAGGTTEYGSEEYGVSTSESESVNITATNSSATCTTNDGGTTATNAQSLTTSDQSYAKSTSPVSSDVVTLCHSASVSATTPAGVYSQNVMITVVGNF
jgi:hypothetical protein